MLDRASIERLSKTPEKNAPMLNVALAEEGDADVLVALARCKVMGPEALESIGARLEREGADVGRDGADPSDFVSRAEDLDRLLILHPRASGALRDAVALRHEDDAFFVLAAAAHARATGTAIERAALWPAASPVHDRLWLALLDPAALAPLTLEEWAGDANVLLREAAARVAREMPILEVLSRDASRTVRRALASNRFAGALREELAARDPAAEVRARAKGPLTTHGETAELGSIVETARFAASLRAMNAGGVLAADVARAFSIGANELDDEGALLAAQVLGRRELVGLVERIVDQGIESSRARSFAAGLALRSPATRGEPEDADEGELAEIAYEAVKCLSRTAATNDKLTGKARLAAWAADGLIRCSALEPGDLVRELSRGPIGAERMILGRSAAARPGLVRELSEAARRAEEIPAALVELAWADASVEDAHVIELAARIEKPRRRAEDLPEDEIDLDPSLRSLDVLERVVLAAVARRNVSPRSALSVTALDSRRVRYVLSAMPQWKGRLTGGCLARVLRQHAGALSAAQAEGRTRAAKIEVWTERVMQETEVAIALAVGHLTGAEVANRVSLGRQRIDDGISLAFGAEARAALEGNAALAPLLAWATKARTQSGPALAVWLLLERLDRERTSALIASAIDSLMSAPSSASAQSAGKAVVHASVTDALAAIERRRPGRLETIHAQSPGGRATLASALARAYRAVGGMRDERQGP
jgi:hypothetical protein